jgi:hypothetical protein
LLDSSLPEEEEEDELEDPDPLEVELFDDSVLVEVPLDVEDEEAFSAAAFLAATVLAAAFFAAAVLAAAVFAAVPLEVDVFATSVVDAVVFLLESAGSCPEASCT